ncbi:MAG: membrane protein insertase YidC [Sneathiella sp.]|nr:membrane protein insertase YidC [Sneathiella sp.]
MSDQKNVILAVVLCFLIIFGFQYFVDPPKIEDPALQQVTEQTAGGGVTPTPAPGSASAPSISSAGQNVVTRSESLKQSPRIKINTPSLHGSVSLMGARIDDLSLVNYREEVDPASPEIKLLSPTGSPHPYYAEFGWSASADAGVKLPDSNTLWQTTSTILTPSSPLVLTWDNGEG